MSRVVVRPLNLEEQLSKFPAELLDRGCVESHLSKLVHDIDTETMVMMATDLELFAVEVDDIQTAWPRKPATQRLEMFKKWQEKKKSQATYRYVHVCVCMCVCVCVCVRIDNRKLNGIGNCHVTT